MTTDRSSDDQRRSLRRRRVLIVIVGLVVLLVGAGFTGASVGLLPATGGWQRAPYQAAGPAATLSDIEDIDQLAALFNERQGVPRLIVLLAPT
ncbi:MAG: hypothetical protein ACRDYA_22480 [Egibacteraceae bacterium]